MLICSCGDQVLAVDYRWLAGFWISFLWYPLNAFTPFEVMSVLKYLSPFMFNHGCLRSRILFFFFFFRVGEGGDESITTVRIHQRAKKVWEKSSDITKHDFAKTPTQGCCCVCAGWLGCSSGLKSWMTGGSWQGSLTRSVTEFDRPIVCFAAVMSFYSMCVMCQELIHMLDELANCSQCIFPPPTPPSPMAPLIWIHLAFIFPHYTGPRYCQVVCEVCIVEIDSGNWI